MIQYCSYPHIAVQKEGKSDISNAEANYNNLFTDSDRVLKRAIKGNADIFALGFLLALSLVFLKVKFSKR